MNTDLIFQISSTNSDRTEQIAEQVGRNLKGGEVIELVSDLGGGKTVFTKGLVKGTGSKDLVSSPTFTISKIYKAPNFEINHFDFYRLGSGGIVSLELQEVLGNPKIVTIIEWANVVSDVLPKNRLKILIENMGQNSRNLIFNYQKEAKYLLKGLIK